MTEIEEARLQISVSRVGLYLQGSRDRHEEAAMQSTMDYMSWECVRHGSSSGSACAH